MNNEICQYVFEFKEYAKSSNQFKLLYNYDACLFQIKENETSKSLFRLYKVKVSMFKAHQPHSMMQFI